MDESGAQLFIVDVVQCSVGRSNCGKWQLSGSFVSEKCLMLNITQVLHVFQEAEYGGHDQIDLYDDVISPSANNGDAPEDRDYMDSLPPSVGDDVGKGAAPNVVYTYTGKRIALYIGNLTWVSMLFLSRCGQQFENCKHDFL